MCGRFSLTKTPEQIADHFDLQIPFALQPRYNIAPGQPILTLRQNAEQQPEAAMLHWGLIPPWATNKAIGNKMVNARAETVSKKPSFRNAYRSRHCLIPVDGFYEWKVAGRHRRPYLFRRLDSEPFTLAGLWERWTDNQTRQLIESCTIITTTANSLVGPVHHRMPVVIDNPHSDHWLDAAQDSTTLLASRDWPDFTSQPISSYVNQAGHEGPECHAPPESATPLFS